MKTIQELSDRREIDDLLIAYAYAIDLHRWDELDDIFTPDAWLDFSATGGEAGDYPTIKTWLARTLDLFAGHQHLVAASAVQLDGDTATARTMCHNPMYVDTDGKRQILIVGLWYHDRLVRTAEGWRISDRRQVRGYMCALPPADVG